MAHQPAAHRTGPSRKKAVRYAVIVRDLEPSGLEGLADLRVIEAMLRSIRTGKPVALQMKQRRQRPTLRQNIRRPAVPREPRLVGVKSASQ